MRGLADRELRFPDNPLDARNRRVSIMVKSPIMAKTSTAGMAVGSGETVSVVAAPSAPAAAAPPGNQVPPAAELGGHEPAQKGPAER